jgi:hypothetical protein
MILDIEVWKRYAPHTALEPTRGQGWTRTPVGVVVLSGATTPWVVSPMRDGVTEWEGFGPLVPRPGADLAKPQYRRLGRQSAQEKSLGWGSE